MTVTNEYIASTQVPDSDIQPMNILALTQRMRIQMITTATVDKEVAKVMKDADAAALGQLRITVDEKAAQSQQDLANAIATSFLSATNPFQLPEGSTLPQREPPRLTQSLLPGEVIPAEHMATEQGSPTYEQVMGKQ